MGFLNRLRLKDTYPEFSNIPQPVLKVIAFIVLFAAIALIRIIVTKVFG